MKHLDLFSGIGGFALASEMAYGQTVEHIFCDIEPFAQAVLAKHWPDSPIYGDIRQLTANAERERQLQPKRSEQEQREWIGNDIDFITGGFPCQPFSVAGRRRGTEDDRYLWPEMLRVIREFRPRWVIGENVSGFVTWNEGMVLEQVCSDLESEGYEVQPIIIPAVAVGAPHRRERVWIVAHRDNTRSGTSERENLSHGQENSQKRQHSLIGTDGQNSSAPDSNSQPIKEFIGGNKLGHARKASAFGWSLYETNWDRDWPAVATELCRVDDGILKRLDRADRLKALGNAIVPQVAAQIFKAIKHAEETI